MILHVWGGLGLTNSSPWSWMDFLQRTACDLGSNYGMLQGSVENFLRIFFFQLSCIQNYLNPAGEVDVLFQQIWGSFTWQVWSSSLADDDDKKSPDDLVNSEANVSKKWPNHFQVNEFLLWWIRFFSAFFFNTYTHHTVDGRNPAPVAKQFITLFTGFFYIPDGAGFLSSTVPSPSFSVEPRNFSRGFSCLNHFSSPFCRCGSLVRKTKFHDLFFWRWHPRMSCSQHVFHFLWIQTYFRQVSNHLQRLCLFTALKRNKHGESIYLAAFFAQSHRFFGVRKQKTVLVDFEDFPRLTSFNSTTLQQPRWMWPRPIWPLIFRQEDFFSVFTIPKKVTEKAESPGRCFTIFTFFRAFTWVKTAPKRVVLLYDVLYHSLV